MPKRFIALYDIHWGYERRAGKLKPFHNARAIDAVLDFASDFKPDVVILGGDIIDCGAVSHHNAHVRRPVEGLRLLQDAAELRANVLAPLEEITHGGDLRYIIGNHEDWLSDIVDQTPALEGIIGVEQLLKLDKWKVIPQGGVTRVGKLWFMHGDTVRSSVNPAKYAVETYERSIRFGHHHTYAVYTKTNAIDVTDARTGIAVPCLCNKNPRYLEGKPSRWLTGFNYGFLEPNGGFNDYVPIITDGKFTAEGKRYGR